VTTLTDPRQARAFRFLGCEYAAGTARLRYAFDDGPELVEQIEFPDAPALKPERETAFMAALHLLHLIAGVSYYKAGVPGEITVDSAPLDRATAELLDEIYLHGLAEFAYQNKLDLRGKTLTAQWETLSTLVANLMQHLDSQMMSRSKLRN